MKAERKQQGPDRKHSVLRASVTYKEEGFLAFLRKPSPKLPVVEVAKEGLVFRSVNVLTEGQHIVLSLRSAQHPRPSRIRAQVSSVAPETRIGEQTYAFRVQVKFVEISSEAWPALQALAE